MGETSTIPAENKSSRRVGPALDEITQQIVTLHKQFYGKGPLRSRGYLTADVMVVLLWGGFTRVEHTLVSEGKSDTVLSQRSEFQTVMRERFTEVVERGLGRKVLAMMSNNNVDPDVCAELFVLAPAEDGEQLASTALNGDGHATQSMESPNNVG